MKYGYLILASLLVGGVAYAAQDTTLTERELRDPKQLEPWLEANASDAETRIAAIEDGSGSLAGATLTGPFVSTSGGGVLDAGSYASKLAMTGTEMCTVATSLTNTWGIGYGAYITATAEDSYPVAFASLVELTDTTGAKTAQGAQFMAFLGTPGGSEAAVLKTLGGDATAGMYGAWLKIGANSNCSTASGSRAAPLWVDNQLSGTVSGEEYGVFMTTGASRPDAAFGFETTSSGYDQLFYFDETYTNGAGTCITTAALGAASNQTARIKVWYDGTQYYLPLYEE